MWKMVEAKLAWSSNSISNSTRSLSGSGTGAFQVTFLHGHKGPPLYLRKGGGRSDSHIQISFHTAEGEKT